MLKMILADDETMVREGLRQILCWEDYDIEIVAEASDGQEALDLCIEHRPDILLTDIRMPHLDGLEAAARIKEQGLELKVILFSGIQDFTYAKSALNINAEGYILKPLDLDELISVVSRVRNKIHSERNIQDRIQHLRQQLQENFGAAREKFLRNLVLGTYQNVRELTEKLVYFREPFQVHAPVAVAVMEVDDYHQPDRMISEEDKQLQSFSVVNIAEEIIRNHSVGSCVVMNENEYVLLCACPSTEDSFAETVFREVQFYLNKYMQLSVTMGAGRMAPDIRSLHPAYQEARTALTFRFYTGRNSIIHIDDVNAHPGVSEPPDLFAEENALVSLVRLGDVDETTRNLEELFRKFSSDARFTMAHIQRVCDGIVYLLNRAVSELGENMDDIAGRRTQILEMIYRTQHMVDLEQRFTEILLRVAEHFSRKYEQKNSKLVADIRRLIRKRYHEDLSIQMIAESVYHSANYISVIFRQETGETIIDCLTQTRMEEARTLLRETDFKILDIAEMVGFQDPSYFSKVFRKHTGIHPQKYRILGNASDSCVV